MANPEHLAILKQGVEVWNQWRQDNTTIQPQVHNVDLSDEDLRGTELKGADLNRADLSAADLRRTNLSRAYLNGAYLHAADLRGADLNGVHLRGTHLSGSRLIGADLSNAVCGYTIFAFTDLSAVKGLDTIHHIAPSSIDTHTLFGSKDLPPAFLRGCGVPKVLIDRLRRLKSDLGRYQTCFISYSHKDKVYGDRVYNALSEKGVDCWYDDRDMDAGDEILRELERNILSRDKLIVCCSEYSLASKYVKFEVDTAFRKERKLHLERGAEVDVVIPLDLDGHVRETNNDISSRLCEKSIIDSRGWEHEDAIFEKTIKRLLKALRTDEGRETPPTPKL